MCVRPPTDNVAHSLAKTFVMLTGNCTRLSSPPELVPGTLLLDVSLSGLVGVGGRFFMGGDPADIFGEPGDAL